MTYQPVKKTGIAPNRAVADAIVAAYPHLPVKVVGQTLAFLERANDRLGKIPHGATSTRLAQVQSAVLLAFFEGEP